LISSGIRAMCSFLPRHHTLRSIAQPNHSASVVPSQ
jgi:hypothetical protein